MSINEPGQVKLTPKHNLISNNYLLLKIGIVILTDIFVGIILDKFVWKTHLALLHTCLELVCILISASIFLLVWQTFRFNLPFSKIFGFGFLAVCIFDLFHTYFFPALHFTPKGFDDLTTRFWIWGRVLEASITLFLTYPKLHWRRINRWVGLALTVAFILLIGHLCSTVKGFMPLLLHNGGVTPIKVAMEYGIIAIYAASMFNLRGSLNDSGIIMNRDIFFACSLAIAAEVSFTLFNSLDSFYNILGHLLKISCYVFYWRGIFASAITYPFAELEKNSIKMTTILNELPSGLTFYDKNLHASFCNRKALEYFECKAEEILGLHVDEVGKRFMTVLDEAEPLLRQVEKKQMPMKNFMRKYRSHTGKIYKFKFNVYPLATGEFMYLFTDAKEEQMLENLQLQTETILNALSNKVLMWDAREQILLSNNAFANWIGVNKDEISQLNWQQFVDQFQFSKPSLHNEIIEGKESGIKCETTLVTPDGNKKDLLLNAAPIFNVEGELIGFIDVFSDITDLKREQQTRIQQEKLALIGQLGAGVVHECKNFLATVKGNSQLLKLASKDEKVQKYAERIDHASEEMNRILSDLLSLAKPRVPVLGNVSLREVVIDLENLLRSSSFLHGIEVQIITGPDKTVVCDEGQLRQVILNLCKNAAEAMADVAKPVLQIQTGLNESSNQVYTKVRDNGKGIPDEVLAKIGTPFFTTKESGTGLGLNISFQIIRDNGGNIEIETELGKGTTFTILLPVRTLEENNLTAASQ